MLNSIDLYLLFYSYIYIYIKRERKRDAVMCDVIRVRNIYFFNLSILWVNLFILINKQNEMKISFS